LTLHVLKIAAEVVPAKCLAFISSPEVHCVEDNREAPLLSIRSEVLMCSINFIFTCDSDYSGF